MNLLTSEEMAKVLRCSYQTFNRLVKRKALPFYEVGSKRMFNLERVLSVLETVDVEKEVKIKSKGRSLNLGTNKYKEMLGI